MMGKHGRKRVLGMICAGAMVVSMAGCGQKTTAKGEEKMEVLMLGFFTPGEGVAKAMKPLMEQYSVEYLNIVLDEEPVSNADLVTKIQTLAAGDELPDVFMLKRQMAQIFVENGKLYAFSNVLDADTEWKGSSEEGVFSSLTINEKIYALPFQVTDTYVFYNTELLTQAGTMGFPKTWDELIEIIPDLRALGVTLIVLGSREKQNVKPVIMSALGNRVAGDDWYQSIRDSSGAKFTDPEFVASLQALSDLAEVGAFNGGINSTSGAQQRQMYMNDEAAITINENRAVASSDRNCPDEMKDVTEMTALPMMEGGKGDPEAITGGAGWTIAVSAKIILGKLTVVTDMLKTMTGPAYEIAVIKEGTLIAVEPGENVEITSTIAAKFDQFTEDRLFTPVYDHQPSSGVIDVMQGGPQELLIERVTSEELVQKIQTEYENSGR